MTNKVQVGVTGGIGSGKSTVCKIFNVLGVPSYDADSRARFIMTNNESIKLSLKSTFGNETFDGNKINRYYLSKLVFENPEELKKLNSIVHPAVNEDYHNWVEKQPENIVVKEAALLVETGSYKVLNTLIVVNSHKDVRVKRILNRDKERSKVEILKIMEQQLSEEKLIEVADFVIYNDESQSLIKQTLGILEKIKAR